MHVVKDYPDVFPEELPGMPPDRGIEFLIELLPGTGPISKRPCRCQNRRITGRGSRTVCLRRMVTGGREIDVLPRFGPS